MIIETTILERYINGSDEDRNAIEIAIPEVGWKKMRELMMLKMVHDNNGKSFSFQAGGQIIHFTIDKV